MSSFTVLLLCIQACLVQNVFSQACGAYGPAIAPAFASPMLTGPCGLNAPGFAYDGLAYPTTGFTGAYPAAGCGAGLAAYGGGLGAYGGTIGSAYGGALAPAAAYGGAIASGAAYGGAGEGNVAVAGELPVAGTTAVAGQVPIMGAVSFGGPVAAAGSVSITGKCACGCGAPYDYLY